MEALEWGGVPTVLFFDPPDAEMLRLRFPYARAVGVAGVSRTLSPTEMDERLPSAFAALRACGAPIFHYKICSTFDSAPHIGSIGRAAEIGMRACGASCVPLIVGAPILKRYVAFSNLFARVDDVTYRLDRHPTMRRHPVTPMDEADLRLHLARQTDRQIAAINLLHLARPAADLRAYYDQLRADGAEIVLFDTVDDAHIRTLGDLLASLTPVHGESPLFVVGSSGVEYALIAHWVAAGIASPRPTPPPLQAAAQIAVMSGSAAPMTGEQIAWAGANGFALVRLDAPDLVDPTMLDAARERAIRAGLDALNDGRSVVLYSAQTPDDPALGATRARIERIGGTVSDIGRALGTAQGAILRAILTAAGLRRAVIAGGDTCSYAARQLGIAALEARMPIAPGAPLCRAYSDDLQIDGMEIALKAGQVGKVDYFGAILRGRG
jgi:uncharacterized protein YgbK (DUF1537 family)